MSHLTGVWSTIAIVIICTGCSKQQLPTPQLADTSESPSKLIQVSSATTQPSTTKPSQPTNPAPKIIRPITPKPTLPAKKTPDLKENYRTPINQVGGYQIKDLTLLPNFLDLLQKANEVTDKGKTTEQYKMDMERVAGLPCRIELKIVDVHAPADSAIVELLLDDGQPGTKTLRTYGTLTEKENENFGPKIKITDTFLISGIKSKGLKPGKSIGDKLTIVGLGRIEANNGNVRNPEGIHDRITLRSFGRLRSQYNYLYEFRFVVSNWYVAQQ